VNTRFVEATQGMERGPNHGKFMVGLFDEDEWARRCEVDAEFRDPHKPMNPWPDRPLLRRCGWAENHILVVDLQTGEGAIFSPGGSATADLNKHKIWVCPMFEPFLEWLYGQVRSGSDWFESLPVLVELPDAPFAMSGYRREGVGV
jgi:hypothetical protein